MLKDEHGLQRRVAGHHDIRMDGMTDLVIRAKGASVLDIGCNRGLVGFEFANNGATVVHGCDNNEDAIAIARGLFADLRAVKSRFHVVDLTAGPGALHQFDPQYDIVLLLATYHKLKRSMSGATLSMLCAHLGKITGQYFAWRGTSFQHGDNEREIAALDKDLGLAGLIRIHTSYISEELGVAAIWARR